MDPAFVMTKKIVQESIGKCQHRKAWNENNHRFVRCTEELQGYIPWLREALPDLEKFVAANMNSTMPLEVQIGQMAASTNLGSFKTFGQETAIHIIKTMSNSSQTDTHCSELPGCQGRVRKAILQFLMMEWGILGLGDSNPGTFLAKNYPILGPYFGSVDGLNWPHNPIANEPLPLEYDLIQEMMKITEMLSNGTLTDVSILDLPAFGSKIAFLEKQHGRVSNWPIEVNSAVWNEKNVTLPFLFNNYKILIEHWKNYMEKIVMKKESQAIFTAEMKNEFFNFTHHIRADPKPFLIAIHGSFLTALKQTLPIWDQVANVSFNQRSNPDYSLAKGHYDKLIMKYAFGQDIFKKPHFDHDAKNESFNPTLTTNGFCYSFNGYSNSDLWKPSEVTDAFHELFPQTIKQEVFQGGQPKDGECLVGHLHIFLFKVLLILIYTIQGVRPISTHF